MFTIVFLIGVAGIVAGGGAIAAGMDKLEVEKDFSLGPIDVELTMTERTPFKLKFKKQDD